MGKLKGICLGLQTFGGGSLVAKLCPTLATPWTVAGQASLSMGFSRQEYWSGVPCPSSGDRHDSGIEPTSPMSPALAGGFLTTSTSWETLYYTYMFVQNKKLKLENCGVGKHS